MRLVRANHPEIIRIMITEMTDIEVAIEAINKGEVFKFFNKPWDDFELLISVRYALRQKEMEDENLQLRANLKNQQALIQQLENENPGIISTKLPNFGTMFLREGAGQ